LQAEHLRISRGGSLLRRHVPGLHDAAQNGNSCQLEGLFLVRVERAFYRWHSRKPFFAIRFSILEPKQNVGQSFSGRLYSTPRALWKLHWFLRDFGYDADLLSRDEVDEKTLTGLRGVVRISHVTVNGHSLLNLDGFAPAAEWEELEAGSVRVREGEAMGDDL
jgi:hypothetical protein